jgi:hypothetical protein
LLENGFRVQSFGQRVALPNTLEFGVIKNLNQLLIFVIFDSRIFRP